MIVKEAHVIDSKLYDTDKGKMNVLLISFVE